MQRLQQACRRSGKESSRRGSVSCDDWDRLWVPSWNCRFGRDASWCPNDKLACGWRSCISPGVRTGTSHSETGLAWSDETSDATLPLVWTGILSHSDHKNTGLHATIYEYASFFQPGICSLGTVQVCSIFDSLSPEPLRTSSSCNNFNWLILSFFSYQDFGAAVPKPCFLEILTHTFPLLALEVRHDLVILLPWWWIRDHCNNFDWLVLSGTS